MPNLAAFHPQIVHFVVSLLLVGVALRIVSIIGRPRFVSPAAALLLFIGTGATVLAVKSGTDAHGPVERIPGTRALVIEHEEAGELTRNVFLCVAALELLIIGMSFSPRAVRFVRIAQAASALVGVYGAFNLYEAAEHGGELVYSYGGGPGLRTGDPRDTERLLLAGLYNQSQADRKAGRPERAAALIDEMAARFPDDTTVRFLHAESLLLDRKAYFAALAAVDSIRIAPTDARLRPRQASLKADIYRALGMPDSARAVLAPVITAFPQNTRLKAKLDSIR
jgi:uncharacterized membrane protein